MPEPETGQGPARKSNVERAMRAAFRGKAANSSPQLGESTLANLRGQNAPGSSFRLRDLPDEDSPVLRQAENGEDVGRYQVLGEVARGGIGVVLKARDPELGRNVALKVLSNRHLGRRDIEQRFIEEAQIGGQLQHPGIVPVYEMGLQAGERPYFTMKLLHGRTLAELLEDRAKPSDDLNRLMSVFEQVCQTVAYAHARGVVHRDLKPSNIMIGSFGEVQVIDWGLSKVLARGGTAEDQRAGIAETCSGIEGVTVSRGSDSVAGSVLGTPAYMPPEQAKGNVDELDERSDVFALGAILCQILTGSPPYTGRTAEEIRQLAASSELGPAHARLDICGADAELVQITKRCLRPERRGRPRDAGVVSKEIRNFLEAADQRLRKAELVAAETQGRLENERRARRLTLALAVCVLVTVLGGAGVWALWSESARIRQDRDEGRLMEAFAAASSSAVSARVSDQLDAWEQARDRVQEAMAMLATADVRPETRTRVIALRDEVAAGLSAATSAAETRARDTEMLRVLTEIPILQFGGALAHDPGESLARQRDVAYVQAFRDYGIAVDEVSAEEASTLLARQAIATELAAAIDDWAVTRMSVEGGEQSGRKLLAISQQIDADPWRRELRDQIAEEKDHREALRALAATADPSNLQAVSILLLSRVLRSYRLLEEQAAFLQTAWAAHPDHAVITYELVGALYQKARQESFDFGIVPDMRAGLVAAGASVALAPENHRNWTGLGLMEYLAGDYDGAVKALRRSIRLSSVPFAHQYVHLGSALSKKGMEEEAIEAHQQAIQLAPEDPGTHAGLGHALMRFKRYEEAVGAFENAIRLEEGQAHPVGSELADYRLQRGRAQFRNNDLLEALDTAVRLERDKDSPSALNLKGSSLFRMGRFREALETHRLAAELEKDNAVYRGNMAGDLRALGLLEEAAVEYRTAIALSERDSGVAGRARLYRDLARTLTDMERTHGAIEALRIARVLDPQSGQTLHLLGARLMELGHYDESLDALRRAVDLGNEDASPYIIQIGRLIDTRPRLEEIIAGDEPVNRLELLDSASLALHTGRHRAVARLIETGLRGDIQLATRTINAWRRAAALSAATAACRHGTAGADLGAQESAYLRNLALEWLREDLQEWVQNERHGRSVGRALGGWLVTDKLHCVRGDALDELAPEEATEWRRLWADVRARLDRLR